MELNLRGILKVQVTEDVTKDAVLKFRTHIGYITEEVLDHMYHDRKHQALSTILELRSAIRTGYFLGIVCSEGYGDTMDYLHDRYWIIKRTL